MYSMCEKSFIIFGLVEVIQRYDHLAHQIVRLAIDFHQGLHKTPTFRHKALIKLSFYVVRENAQKIIRYSV